MLVLLAKHFDFDFSRDFQKEIQSTLPAIANGTCVVTKLHGCLAFEEEGLGQGLGELWILAFQYVKPA